MAINTDQNQEQVFPDRTEENVNLKKGSTPQNRRQILGKMAAGAAAFAGLSVLPDRWSTPLVEFAILPAHAATSGTETNSTKADPPFTQIEVIEKAGMISIDKVLRPKFISSKRGPQYGPSMKIVFDTGGVIHVPDTSNDVITREERVYRAGGRAEIPTMEVYAEPKSSATKITIHY